MGTDMPDEWEDLEVEKRKNEGEQPPDRKVRSQCARQHLQLAHQRGDSQHCTTSMTREIE